MSHATPLNEHFWTSSRLVVDSCFLSSIDKAAIAKMIFSFAFVTIATYYNYNNIIYYN